MVRVRSRNVRSGDLGFYALCRDGYLVVERRIGFWKMGWRLLFSDTVWN